MAKAIFVMSLEMAPYLISYHQRRADVPEFWILIGGADFHTQSRRTIPFQVGSFQDSWQAWWRCVVSVLHMATQASISVKEETLHSR